MLHELLPLESTGLTLIEQAFSKAALREFRIEITTISRELLRSYLNDLLDLTIPEERLFIRKFGVGWWPALIAAWGMSIVLFFSALSLMHGAPLLLTSLVSAALLFPFATLWYFVPRARLTRRMRFAKVVSEEIERRYGRGNTSGVVVADPAQVLQKFRPAVCH